MKKEVRLQTSSTSTTRKWHDPNTPGRSRRRSISAALCTANGEFLVGRTEFYHAAVLSCVSPWFDCWHLKRSAAFVGDWTGYHWLCPVLFLDPRGHWQSQWHTNCTERGSTFAPSAFLLLGSKERNAEAAKSQRAAEFLRFVVLVACHAEAVIDGLRGRLPDAPKMLSTFECPNGALDQPGINAEVVVNLRDELVLA